MPPKAKFTREEIVESALKVIRSKGAGALTARSLAAELESSPRPIFTVFSSMDEVMCAAEESARGLYESYVDKGMESDNPFKGTGESYIRFAMEEPKLFQLLFMSERESTPDLKAVLPVIDDYYEKILLSVQKVYGFNRADADKLYKIMWIYSHGIATLIATNVCAFEPREISGLLTAVCKAQITEMKK